MLIIKKNKQLLKIPSQPHNTKRQYTKINFNFIKINFNFIKANRIFIYICIIK